MTVNKESQVEARTASAAQNWKKCLIRKKTKPFQPTFLELILSPINGIAGPF